MIEMPWTNVTAPHYILEINACCNITCRGCYKKLDGTTKPFDRVVSELDQALARRRIQTVSLGGGEPTLHPHLGDIIRYIHRKGLKVSLLTNGLLLDDNFLRNLKSAGLDLIMFHVDEGQERPDLPFQASFKELSTLRSTLTTRAQSFGLDTGLSVTMYPEYIDRVPALIEYVLQSKQIGSLFVSHYLDFSRFMVWARYSSETGFPRETRTTNQAIMSMMKNSFGCEPFGYLHGETEPGEDRFDPRWILFIVPVVYSKGKRDRIGMRYGKKDAWLLHLLRLITGNYYFYCRYDGLTTAVQVLWNKAVNGLVKDLGRFLTHLLRPGARVKGKYIVFENGPVLHSTGKITCCRFCPNATLRNNELTHTCLADHCPDEN